MTMNHLDPLAGPEDGGAPPGYRLGNFELQGVVTLHANGVVYRGWDHNLGIPVAIKEYLPQRLAWRKPDGDIEPLDGDTIDAFERGRHAFVDEARLLARCDHPNLVRVRQLLQAHGTAYRVMQWYSGRPLLDVRREMTSPPDEPALRALLSELLGALEAYHRVGGVHGSVNPAQIMLLDDDRALLLGPCAARRATAIDAVESLMRQLEPSFVAPEQLAPSDSAPLGPWTDFYALARVVRFCISGMLPAPPGGATPEPLGATVAKLYFDKPGVHYSESFLATLDAAAAPEIHSRPQTVAEFCQWLDEGPRRSSGASMPGKTASPHSPRETLPDMEAPPAPAATAAPAAGFKQAPAPGSTGAPASHASPPPALAPGPSPDPKVALGPPAEQAWASPTAPSPRDEAPDAETIALIQRVIESIPPPSIPLIEPVRPEPPWQTDRDHQPTFGARPPRRTSHPAWLLLVLPLLAFIGYAAWELLHSPPRMAAPGSMAVSPPAPAPAARPAPSATSPASPTATVATEVPREAPMVGSTPGPSTQAAAERSPVEPATPAPEATSGAPEARAPQATPAQSPTPRTSEAPAATTTGGPAPAAPAPPALPGATARSTVDSPREACGDRTHFSLYRCMQQQCAGATWARHPQCVRLKATDNVD